MPTPAARLSRVSAPLLLASAIVYVAVPLASAEDAPKLAGTWTWTWTGPSSDEHRCILEVEGAGDKVAAREIYDDQQPVKVTDLKLDGRSIKFTVVRGGRRSDYNGKIADDDHINGTVLVTTGGNANEFVWKAERRKDVPK